MRLRMPVRLALALCALALPAALWAQAPIITSAGDPTVQNDTIYRLAVDPADHPDEAAVLLLDDGVERYDSDGTGTTTFRQVTQVLSADAVEVYAEHELSYAPAHQRLTINWARVVRPDGTVVSDAPTQVQDADVPAALANPVYQNLKIRRFSLSGVAPGTLVDVSYTLEERHPFLRGDFLTNWGVHTGRFTRRSRYLVDLPATLQPRLVERNLTFPRQEREVRGRRVYLWATQDVPRVRPELYMADSNGVWMTVQVGAPTTWETIGRWYAGLARERYTLDTAAAAKVRTLAADAHTADDTLRALHRWVAQDIRYVSVALGIGGYQPRSPAEVVTSGYGDCKDKATLFIAAAGALGFRAFPVLLNSGGRIDRRLPSLSQLDHAIAAVERPGGRVYVDLTDGFLPYGELPSDLQGGFGLLIHPDGSADTVTLPESTPAQNLNAVRIAGRLWPDGYLDASYEERHLGTQQDGWRSAFSSSLDATRRATLARSIASKLYPGSFGDSLELFDGRDLGADPKVSLRIVHAQAARPAGNGGTVILTLPFKSTRSMADLATALEANGPRRFPIDAAQVIGPLTGASELTLQLPDDWHAQLPPSIAATGKWGSYTASYTQDGNRLQITRHMEGTRGVYPPEMLADLLGWLREVAKDDVPYIVLEPVKAP